MKRYTKLSLILIAVAAVVFYLVSFRLENVEIRNDSVYTDEEIRSMIFKGSRLDKYTHFFAWRVNRNTKSKIPFVEKTDVEIVDKNSVIIYVYGKSVAGCVEHMGKYIHFDREGIVVESADSPLEGIPVVKGLKFEDVTMGTKLKMGNSDLFDSLMGILKSLEKNSLSASEIVFGLRNDITLHTGDDMILLGIDGDNDYRIKNIGSVMRSLTDEYGERAFKIDMRTYSPDDTRIIAGLMDDNADVHE